jgi:hypothetical protein
MILSPALLSTLVNRDVRRRYAARYSPSISSLLGNTSLIGGAGHVRLKLRTAAPLRSGGFYDHPSAGPFPVPVPILIPNYFY